jgi:excisionase family DNA binding protein
MNSDLGELAMEIVLLTPDEVAAILKVPRSWLYGRIHAGTLPFRYRKVGQRLRFLESDVRDYIERSSQPKPKITLVQAEKQSR